MEFESSEANESFNKKNRRKIISEVVVFGIGLCLLYSGYSATIILQTSINVEDGKGSLLTSVAYANALVMCFFVVTSLVRFLGIKRSMLLAELFFLCYTLGSLASNTIILQICSLLGGIADSIFWIPLGLINVYYAKKYKQFSPDKSEDSCLAVMSGIIFLFFQLNTTLGNTVVYIVFQVNKPVANISNEVYDLSFCGPNDCQNPNITRENISMYVPPRSSINTLVISLIIIQIVGLVLHYKYIPTVLLGDVNETNLSPQLQKQELEKETSMTNLKKIFQSIKDTWTFFLFNKNQWLMIFPGVSYGFSTAFLFSEFSRAYISCMLGVSMIGKFFIVFSLIFAFSIWVLSILTKKKGRRPILTLLLLFNLSVNSLCLLWQPSHQSLWVIYIISVLIAIYLAIQQLFITIFYSLIYPKKKELCFIYWNVSFFVGWTLQFGWSTSVCVKEKLYTLLGSGFVSWIFLVILNRRLSAEPVKTNQNEEKEYFL